MSFTQEEKKTLGAIARAALAAAVRDKADYAPPAPDNPALLAKCGCFVTLKTGGGLRGCIGCFTSDKPIYQTVAEYTRHSALEDPRFGSNRLRPEELDKVEMDVSVLTPLRECRDPMAVRLGVDGIYVRKGMRSGCFLPQVAEETGWTLEEFWGHCCRDKAGLDWDAWKKPGVELSTFTAVIIDC